MTREELIKKLQDIEWEDFEIKKCKEKIASSVWETVSAFSNTNGGWLIFGVEQKGKHYNITGLSNPQQVEQNFTTALRGEKFNTKIIPLSKKYSFPEGTILAFYIEPKSPRERPVYFNNNQHNTFIRIGSGDQRATKEEIDAMFRNASFDEKDNEVLEWGIEALDGQTIESYRNFFQSVNPGHRYLGLSNEDFLTKLRVLENGKVTIGGILVFGKEDYIYKKLPGFKIDYLEIEGTSYTDAPSRYKYRMACEYNLFNTFFDIYPRLIKNIDVPFSTEGGVRNEDQPQVQALREALVNLLIHSDYFSKGTFRIRIFSDRIEFFNSGGLPKDLDFILKQDFSMPRNPIIAKCFRYLQLAENLGSGFHKMIDGWLSYYKVKPDIDGDFDYYTISFPLNEIRTKKDQNSLPVHEMGNKNIAETTAKEILLGGNEGIHSRSSRKKWIMRQIRLRGKIKTKDVMTFFKISKKTSVRDINDLIKEGKVVRNGRSSNIYYTFTKEDPNS